MRRALAVFALLVGLPLSVAACLWDRDTPAEEARGMPEVVAVLTGRFERNPPLYYEMRLARMALHLQSHPDDLAAYDDAGVACDRLGLGDEAISWMDRKRVELEKLDASRPQVREHLSLAFWLFALPIAVIEALAYSDFAPHLLSILGV